MYGQTVRTAKPFIDRGLRKALLVISAVLSLSFVLLSGATNDSAILKYRSPTRALYINLERRVDRRKSIESQLAAANFKFSRVNAVDGRTSSSLSRCWHGPGNYTCAGMIGVKLSHIRALDAALQTKHNFVLIFEDDFVWSPKLDPASVAVTLNGAHKSIGRWDVILLSSVILEKEPLWPTVVLQSGGIRTQLVEVRDAQAANAYAVKREYISKLKSVFVSCEVTRRREIAIDQCWKTLQRKDRWVGFSPPLGVQAPGYSDIELLQVNYTAAFV